MDTVQIIMILYIIACLAIGVWSAKYQTNLSEFYVAGRRLGPMVLGIAISSTIMSGYGWVGAVGSAYLSGYAIFWLTIPAAWGVLFSYWALGEPLRRISEQHGLVTLPDFIELRYNSQFVRLMATIAIIVGLMGYTMTNLKALGAIVQTTFGIDYVLALTVGVLVLGVYVIMGGMLAAAITDALQGVLMMVCAIAAVFLGLKLVGGFSAMHADLATVGATYLQAVHDSGPFGLLWVIGTVFLYSFGVAGQPHVVNKFYQINNMKMIKFSMIMGVVSYTLVGFAYFLGPIARTLTVRGQLPDLTKSTDLVSSTFITQFMPPVLAGLVMASIVAAIMSTSDSMVLTASSAFTKDIHLRYFSKKQLTPQQEINLARIYSMFFMLISYIFVIHPPTIVTWMGYAAWGILVSTLFPLLVIGVRWKRPNKMAASASIIAGFVLSFGLTILKFGFKVIVPVEPAILGFAVSLAVFVLVSLFTQPEDNAIFNSDNKLSA